MFIFARMLVRILLVLTLLSMVVILLGRCIVCIGFGYVASYLVMWEEEKMKIQLDLIMQC